VKFMKNIVHNFFGNIENRTLLLINLWPGSPMHYTKQLANKLAMRNEVTLILSRNCDKRYIDKSVEIILADLEVPFRYQRIMDYIRLLNIFYYFKVLKIVSSKSYDFLIIIFFHPFVMSLLNTKNKIFIYHDPFGHLGEKNVFLHIMQRLFSYHCDYVVVHDEHLIPQGIPLHEQKKYKISNHGTFDFLKEIGDREIKPEREILFIGRFVKYKGVEYLIRAFAEIQNEFSDWKLVIKGSGKPYFKKELKKINPDQLVFENKYLSDEELVNSVRRASIIALPYVDGSHSGVYELARTFGKRVVGKDINFGEFCSKLKNALCDYF